MATTTDWRFSVLVGAAGAVIGSGPAHAGEEEPLTQSVIITAQKQEQTANSVGMSITTATGDSLRARGIEDVQDLPRLVPGLTIQHSAFNSTSFTLRGVGFFNSDLATPGAVTVYVDEAPLAFPAMTRLAAFDIARVEVLKGPQGTLFGDNATGGAINYIAAKPTSSFVSGADLSYGNFNRVRASGFVSGPIDDQLAFRVALQTSQGDPWQQSTTRPGDRLGRIADWQGRASLAWHASDSFHSRLTLTATHDGSDSEAAQFIRPLITVPALSPGLATYPIVTGPRAADWTPVVQGSTARFPYASDTSLYQLTWRNELRVAQDITVTALTSLAEFRMNYGEDPDGTPYHLSEEIDRGGRVSSWFQELRAAGRAGRLDWLAGANIEHERTRDDPSAYNVDNSVSHVLQAVDPSAIADTTEYTSRLRATSFGAFGRLQYDVDEQLSLEAGARLNRDERSFDNCAIATTDAFARFWNLFRGNASPPTRVGDCYVLDTANGSRPVSNVHSTLDQNSFSWRLGANWTWRPGIMTYANVSKGYKAGAVPVLAAATVSQFNRVPQESLLAYETGIKATLFGGDLQANLAAFYYDYRDKQLRGAELDPNFGPLQALVSIPRSHVVGAEAQLIGRPILGLTIDVSATYVDTNIDRFTGFDALANFGDHSGTVFPFSPRWQAAANVDYEGPLAAGTTGFVGASLSYSSKTYAGVGELDLMRIDGYSLLDLRAGVAFGGATRCRVWLWGKNVGNTYYWSNVFVAGDAASRFAGQPATYGISVSARF
jgi:outer membrane receptor protein involved in Fe transport